MPLSEGEAHTLGLRHKTFVGAGIIVTCLVVIILIVIILAVIFLVIIFLLITFLP